VGKADLNENANENQNQNLDLDQDQDPARDQKPGPGPGPVPEPALRFSLAPLAGAWAKSRSDGSGRSLDSAYGLRFSYGFLDDRLEAELELLRAGGTAGSPFANASTTHNLFMLRAFYVLGPPQYALLLGIGAAF
jgi:hypothetical protein